MNELMPRSSLGFVGQDDQEFTLNWLQKKVAEWRKTRKREREPMPKELWKVAVDLAKKSSIGAVARKANISYTDLKKKIEKDSAGGFVELKLSPKPLESNNDDWTVEMETAGRKMKIKTGSHGIDLIGLTKLFWEV